MTILPKVINRFNTVPFKIPMDLIAEMEKLILKFTWNFKRCQIAKSILEKNKVGVPLLNFTTYYKAKEMKTVCYWTKNR